MASLSEEEENYVRMSLLLTGISPRAVRTYFDSEFAPACLGASLKKEYNKLLDLKKKRIINQSQWNLLLPRLPAVPDSKIFDVTLMITLLRNLTPLKPPLVGFDRLPSAIETSPASDLARIKYYRSFLAHLDYGKLDTTYMTTAWTDMTGAICRLGGTQMKLECDHLKTKPLDQTNQDVMIDIKRSNDEIRVLKESQYLQEDHRKVTKEMEILESTLSEKEENYVRMSLLLTGISSRAVRTFFDSEFAPAYLEATIKKEYNKLFELKKKHRINQSQWNLLFPRLPDVPDSKTFDVTLMILLLQFLTPLTPPLNGFDRLPSDMEITPAADLARIKHYRNYLAHLDEGKLDIGSFNTAWNDITCAIDRLGGQQIKQECDLLKTRTLDQTHQEIMTDIKHSNDGISNLKESLRSLKRSQLLHAKVIKEMKIIKTSQEEIVPWNFRARINHTLKGWKDNDDRMFISTRAAQYVLKCIQENSCVTITASSGVGKTAILRHVALQMKEEGYDILIVTDPEDIVRLYNPNKKTLFVVDDLCGNFSIDQSDIRYWEPIMEDIKQILDKKQTKIIAACRLQVYQDEKFDSLSVFKSCVCNMLSENVCLSKTEKELIAKLYLNAKASEISDFYDLYDCFPLLCKLYHDNPKLIITDFFKNPYSVYAAEIDKLMKKGHYAKLCALALCVMFNNKLKKEIFTEEVNEEITAIIGNTCEACKLKRETSRLVLQYELESLIHTFIKKEQNVYKIIHNKLFDFLAYYYGQKIIQCLIKNAHSGLIKERFLLKRQDDMDQFITVIPPQYHQIYIQRMVDDLSQGKLQDVFSNINMKIPLFRQRFLCYLKTLDMSQQRQLAHTCDVNHKDTVLLRCCFIGDCSLIRWCLIHDANVNQSRCDGVTPLIAACHKGHTETVSLLVHNNADLDKCSKDGLTPLFAAKGQGHTEIVKLLLENKAKIFDRRDDSSKDDRIPIAIRKMEPWSIELYLKTLKSGSEKRRDLTLVVVGKKGAGKTSLVRRLFGEELTNLESTNGIEIHRRQCKIKSDQWTKKADKDSDFNKRILESVVDQLYLNEKEQILSESSPGMLDRQNIYPNIAESLDEEEIVIERIDDKVDVIYGKIADDNDVIYERVVDKDEVDNDRIESSRQEIDMSVPVLVQETDQPSNEIMQTSEQIASKELSAISDTDVVLKDDEDFTTLTLWDFAGDEEFYATHQTFLNPDAVYILVANLNDKDKDNANHEHVTFKFWMDTIHCYGCRVDTTEVGPINQATLLNPPVIFVGTHEDELQHENECSMQLECHMDTLCVDTRRHLRKCHLISNKSGGKSEFDKIRKDIFDLATNSITTEKEYPVKFIQLERLLHVEYTSGTRIFSFMKVQELASKISIPITDEEELNLFLRYQNEIGNLVFFRDIPEYIILDPLWLSDAFKCIVTATHFQKELPYFSEWKEVKRTGKISFQLIKEIFKTQENSIKEHQEHVLAVMEKFDIIINPLGHPNKSSVSSDAESYYYIPCMMQVQKIEEIDKLFKVEDEYKSTCLCFIFNFLPPYLMSHLIVSCLRKYSVASVKQQEGLFKDCCVFDVSDCRCIKLLLVKFGNMIEIQVWQWDKEQPCQYNEIFNFIEGEINRILTTRYRMTTVSFVKKWKCSLTNYTCENSFEEFGKKTDGETFLCQEHAVNHRYKDDWFCETSKIDLNQRHINFTKMGIITLDVLADALYDLILVADPNFTSPRSECDISKLYNIHRNKMNVFIPSRGSWGGQWVDINSNATAPGDDIERIRLTRNELQHSSKFELQDARFVQLCNLHKKVLGRLETKNNVSDYVQRFENILKKKMTFQDWKTCKEKIIFVCAKVQLPSSTTASKGCGCTINCNINSQLPYESTICWFKEHKGVDEPVIVDSIKYHGSRIEFPSLVISNVDKCDEGFYSCRIVYPTNYQYEEETEAVVWPKTYLHVNSQ